MLTSVTTLRERKKARTKTAIQQQALRLFAEQGYHATTVEQVAEAAEVATSTVFRYFPTKEDLTVLDDYYPLAKAITQALTAQPPELSPIGAFRRALRAAFDGLTPTERAARYERDLLIVTVPELWTANLGLLTKARRTLREQLAERVGSTPDDNAIRATVDAIVGVSLGVLFDWTHDRGADPIDALDQALAGLETAHHSWQTSIAV
jgi:AcrR family transcriptional regulator